MKQFDNKERILLVQIIEIEGVVSKFLYKSTPKITQAILTPWNKCN